MHEIWIVPSANMMYTRSKNYINLVIGEHKMQTFKVVVVVLLFLLLSLDGFVLTSVHPLLFLDK